MIKIKRIIFEVLIRTLPPWSSLKHRLLMSKYFQFVRFRGKGLKLAKFLKIERASGLVLGNNVTIEGKGRIDAMAGLMLGDNVTIKEGVNIESTTTLDGAKKYEPIVIGAGNIIKESIGGNTILPAKHQTNGLSAYHGQIVFIVSTGRSGSKTIANLIDQHPQAECFHDAFPHLNTWSCDMLYDRIQKAEIHKRINALYNSTNIGKGKVHGQSDQKLTPFIGLLTDVFPKAKFIWLIRKADSWINSSYPRGWFDNSEFKLPPHPKEFYSKQVSPSVFDADHRINGYLVGEFSQEKWSSMTRFERNCWYWIYWNELIEKQLSLLPREKWIQIKLDELEESKIGILDFLGLHVHNLSLSKVNSAKYTKLKSEDWTSEMRTIFDFYCKEGMEKWYND